MEQHNTVEQKPVFMFMIVSAFCTTFNLYICTVNSANNPIITISTIIKLRLIDNAINSVFITIYTCSIDICYYPNFIVTSLYLFKFKYTLSYTCVYVYF